MKNKWSPIAGMIGFGIGLLAGAMSDFPDTYITRVFCAGLVLLGLVMHLLRLDLAGWSIIPLVLIGALANAAWYMAVVEAIRLLFKKLSPP